MSGVSRVQTASRSSKAAASRSRSICRPSRERRTEKKTRNSKRREHASSLGRALSEIATEVPHILVPDAADFATRAIELRHGEATNAGKIKRPLNAFMLYRRSYQNVAKTCCTRNNHQQVSAVCGESWTSCEPPDVISEFNRLATIERQMHEQAFPNYKYDPLHSKKGDDQNAAPSQPLDTSNLEHVSGCGIARGNKANRNMRNTPKHNLHSGNDGYPQAVDEQLPLQVRPVASHPHWTSPVPQAHPTPYFEDQHAFLYSGSFQTHSMLPGEDCLARISSPPGIHGLYGDAMDHCSNFTEIFIDPSLLPCQPGMVYDLPNCPLAVQEQWHQRAMERSRSEAMMPDVDMAGSYDAYLRGTKHDWKIEQLEEPSQFEDWMSQADM
ncbi:hypothetical protein V8C37DRAFT_64889 [Trichoderma ceciliae]